MDVVARILAGESIRRVVFEDDDMSIMKPGSTREPGDRKPQQDYAKRPKDEKKGFDLPEINMDEWAQRPDGTWYKKNDPETA